MSSLKCVQLTVSAEKNFLLRLLEWLQLEQVEQTKKRSKSSDQLDVLLIMNYVVLLDPSLVLISLLLLVKK